MTQSASFLRLASQWVIAAILAAVLAALFLLVAAYQLTSDQTGTRAHRRAVATLTEIDKLLPSIETALDETDVPEDGSIQAPGFPIPVELTADEARDLRGAGLRDRLLDEAAASLYDDGMGLWAAAEPDRTQHIERISAAGGVKTGLTMANDSRNSLFLAGVLLFGVVAFLLAAGLAVAVRDANIRLVALGSVVVAAALPCLAAAIAVRFAFKTAQTDADPVINGMLDLGVDSMWIPIRDYLTLSGLGFAVAGLGALGAWLERRAYVGNRPAPAPVSRPPRR